MARPGCLLARCLQRFLVGAATAAAVIVAGCAAPASTTAPDAAPRRAQGSMLGLDLTLLATQDMSVVPGTASRNAATLIAPAAGREGRVELRKLGIDFSLPVGRDPAHDGRAVATAALLEVSAIEMFG